MTTTYNLAPQPNWRFFYPANWSDASLAGTPLVGGQLYTYQSTSHSTPKSTYVDPDGDVAQANPIILDANGEPEFPIYWALDDTDQTDLYYFEVRSPATLADPDGTLIYAFDKFDGSALFPLGDNSKPEENNLLTNGDFRFWSGNATFTITTDLTTLTADNWYIEKNVGDGNEVVTKTANPTSLTIDGYYPTPYCLNWNVTNAGTSGYRALSQTINDVYTLAGKEITFSIRAKVASGTKTFVFAVVQNFGTGGSTEVETTFNLSADITTSYQNLYVTATVPSITGKTVGSYGDDFVKFQLRETEGETFNLTVNEAQIQIGPAVNDYQYQTETQETASLLPTLLNFQTGWMLHGQLFTSIPGFVILQDGTIGDGSSNATARANADCYPLFKFLWENTSEFLCPVFTSAGLLVAKSADATAKAAWDLHKAISVPRLASRTVGITGAGVIDSIVTFSSSSGLLATMTSVGAGLEGLIFTGTEITFLANGGTLPTGITDSTTYYAIYDGPTTIKIATSFANAIAGTAIAYTNSGSGTLRFRSGYLAKTLGTMLGEETHVQLEAEVGRHVHPPLTATYFRTTSGGGSVTIDSAGPSTDEDDETTGYNTQTTGFNIIQPTTFLNSFIKL